MICTTHDRGAINDSCYLMNTNPRWGEYETLERGCGNDNDCTEGAEAPFTCAEDDYCDFSCSSSSECLAVSSNYLCDLSADSPACIGSDPENDPTLDIDDVDGWGPENISLVEPADGRYRIVARLYADSNDVLSETDPATAHVSIYIDGVAAMEKELSLEFVENDTYWKVADIDWSNGSGVITPLCAGWTATACAETSECSGWFGTGFECAERSAEAGKFCKCEGSDPYEIFNTDPYANPFISTTGARMEPYAASFPRSIWCDAPTDKYNETDTCESLYAQEE